MTETTAPSHIIELVEKAVTEQGLSNDVLNTLSSQFLWRMGQNTDKQTVIIRVGLAGSAALFSDLPKLKGASDLEIEAAIKTGDFLVEWVG